MTNKIELLSPGQNCCKTRKIISKIEKFINSQNIDAEFIINSELEKFFANETWILPTIIINGKIVARGYKPNNNKIINNLIK